MEVEPSEGSEAAECSDEGHVQLGSSSDTDVKVVVRVRPQVLSIELQPEVQTCVEYDGFNSLTVRTSSEAHRMAFNWVAAPATTQSEFFKVVGRPTVEACLSGFNSCIFAYGQTGSGKTHTMLGELPDKTDVLTPNAGLLPRIFQYLWRRMPEVQASMLAHTANTMAATAAQGNSDDAAATADQCISSSSSSSNGSAVQPSLTWLVRCSMVELHREEIYDLLRPHSGCLNLREDIRKGVYVEGLAEKVVDSAEDALDELRTGIALRQVSSTEYNAASSRSHCIFTCHVESRLEPQPGLVNVRSSRLHMVDLAGSERLRYGQGGMGCSEGSGQLLKETTAINNSLSVLGLVILKLTESQPHIPYRNSKLTFLLQDSIGGNAKTIIIANISPSEACLQETLSTLKFATRARKLVNKAVINEDTSGDAQLLRQENKRLKQELALAHELMRERGQRQTAGQLAAEQLEEQQAQLQQALCLLSELGGKTTLLAEALEYSKLERAELDKRLLADREEIAALQVSLNQKEKEARSWRHKWFKVDKVAHSNRASADSAAGSHAAAPAATPAAPASTVPATPGQSLQVGSCDAGCSQQAKEGMLVADAIAAQAVHQEGDKTKLLVLLSAHLTELVDSMRPQAAAAVASTDTATQVGATTAVSASTCRASKVRESLNQLTAAFQQSMHQAPELGSIISSLEMLADWQQKQQQLRVPSAISSLVDAECQVVNQTVTVAKPPSADASVETMSHQAVPAAGAAAVSSTTSGVPRVRFVPSELHRQLEEERHLTAQLQEQVRQLQQQVGLAAETSSSSVTKSCNNTSFVGAAGARSPPPPLRSELFLSTDSMLRGSTVAVQTVSERADAATAGLQQEQHVVLQLHIDVHETSETALGSQAAAETVIVPGSSISGDNDTAAAKIEALRQQVDTLQQQLEMLTKEKAHLQTFVTAARSALIAARCPTPSSLNSSRLPSPQPCFSPFRPLYGESIDEEPEQGSPAVTRPGSWCKHTAGTCPGSPSTPVKQLVPAISPNSASAAVEGLSNEELWQQQHQEWHQHLKQFANREELTRAVHAAIMVAAGQKHGGMVPDINPPLSPADPRIAGTRSSTDQCITSADQAAVLKEGMPGQLRTDGSQSDLEELLQQQMPPMLQLPTRWGAGFRASGGDLAAFLKSCRLPIQDLLQEGATDAQQQQQQPTEQGDTAAEPAQSTPAAAAGSATAQSPSFADALAGPCRSARSSLSHSGSCNMVLPSESQPNITSPDLQSSADAMVATAAEAISAATAASDVEVGEEAISSLQPQEDAQQPEQQQAGPAWDLDDYEQEFTQLRQQLQELIAANSSLKAAVQQRDVALADKDALLDQLSHQLDGSEAAFQAIQERLAASEAQRSAAAAEHCDAIWAKGQVAGLRELNEQLQMQLEQKAEEVEELKATLARIMFSAAPNVAEAYASAEAAMQQLPSSGHHLSATYQVDSDPTSTWCTEAATTACMGAELLAATAAEGNTTAVPGIDDDELQGDGSVALEHNTADEKQQLQQLVTAVGSTAQPMQAAATPEAADQQQLPVCSDEGAISNADTRLSQTAPDVVELSCGQETASCMPQHDSQSLKWATDGAVQPLSAAIATASTPIVTPAAAPHIVETTMALATISAGKQPEQMPVNKATPQSPSLAKKLRLQTSQLSAQPSNLEIAAEQAILLRHQLEAVGLQLQQKQLEAKLAQVKMQMERLQQHQKVQLQQQQLQLQRYQRHSAQLQQEVLVSTTPKKHTFKHGGSDASGAVSVGFRAVTTGARLRPGHYSVLSPTRSPVGAFSLPPKSPASAGQTEAAGAHKAGTHETVSAAAYEQRLLLSEESSSSVSAVPPAAETVDQGSAGQKRHRPVSPDFVDSALAPVSPQQRRRCSSSGASEATTAVEPATPESTACADSACHNIHDCQNSLLASASNALAMEQSQVSCASNSSDDSDCSLGCNELFSDLLAQLQALARESHEISTFTAASASTLQPVNAGSGSTPGAPTGWPSGAVQMQTKLQVSSALHLEATRGLMRASTAVMELQNELSTAEKQHTGAQRQHQREQNGTSPPLARSLLSKFNGAEPAQCATTAGADVVEDETRCIQTVGVVQQTSAESADAARCTSPVAGQQNHHHQQQQQKDLLHVLETLAQQQQDMLQKLTNASTAAAAATQQGTSVSEGMDSGCNLQHALPMAQLEQLQQVQQQLLGELHEAKAAVLSRMQCHSLTPSQQQPTHQDSVAQCQVATMGAQLQRAKQQEQKASRTSVPLANVDVTCTEPEDGLDTPKAAAVVTGLSLAAATANAAVAGSSGSRSPTRRQRSKQRELLRMSQEGIQQQQQQDGGIRSDQHQLRDSCKEGRMQQLIRGAKASGSLLEASNDSSVVNASCQTAHSNLSPSTGRDVKGVGRKSPALQLRVDVPCDDVAVTAALTANEEPELVTQLRGEVIKLQLQLQDHKRQKQLVETRYRALLQQSRSHSSCSNRGESDSTDAFMRSSVDALLASSVAAQRPPLMPPGLFSPRGPTAGAAMLTTATSLSGSGSFVGSTGLASPGSSAAITAAAAVAAGKPNAVLTLTSQVHQLKSKCMSQADVIKQLKDQLQRQELQLKQQNFAAAGNGSLTARGGSSGGYFSPRVGGGQGSGGSGVFSPRVASAGSGLFSPRVMSTPARAASTDLHSGVASPAAGAGYDASSGIGNYGGNYIGTASSNSPTKAFRSPLGAIRAATVIGESRRLGCGFNNTDSIATGWPSHQELSAVPEVTGAHEECSRRSNMGKLAAQPLASSSGSRRLSMGGGSGKGVKMAMVGGGRLRLAAMSRLHQQRRQSMG